MAVIRLDPEDVRSKGVQFDNKAADLESLLSASQAMVSQLQGGSWTGNRANSFYSEWDSMKPQITKAIETMRQAGMLLKRAAGDFAATDSAR